MEKYISPIHFSLMLKWMKVQRSYKNKKLRHGEKLICVIIYNV